jgi:hypothetical protein
MSSETSHDDLMDLASRFAYNSGHKTVVDGQVTVNGTKFDVLEYEQDTVTGLDAYVFQNTDTGELTVAFQGTADATDTWQDALLVTSQTPPQYEAALAYVHDVESRFGRVSSVCGNSLGGGEAAFVGVQIPRIMAVTVSPAPVPAAYAGVDAPNVTNYIAPTDPLHRALVAGGMADRVVGRTVQYPGSSYHLEFLGANHVGSDREASSFDASMVVPFSLVDPNHVLSAGHLGARVDISVENLRAMADGVARQRGDLVQVSGELVEGLSDELWEYGRDVPARTDERRREVQRVIAAGVDGVCAVVEEMHEDFCRGVRDVVDRLPVPGPIRWAVRSLVGGVAGCAADLAQAVTRMRELEVHAVVDGVWWVCATPYVNEAQALASGLSERCGELVQGLGVVDRKWEVFCGSATDAVDAIERADALTAASIAARSCLPGAVQVVTRPWPDEEVPQVPLDSELQIYQFVADVRQTATGELVGGFARNLAFELTPLTMVLSAVGATVVLVEELLHQASSTVRAAIGLASATPLDELLGIDDDLERCADRIEQLDLGFRRQAVEWLDAIAAANRVVNALPGAIDQFREQLDDSFFSDAQIERTYDALQKCQGLVDRSQLAFAEVEHQLDGHDALAIDALADRSVEIQEDLGTLGRTLSVMIG